MRFLWWEGHDWLLGLGLALAALPVVAAVTAPGPEVGRLAGRVQPGMLVEEAEGVLGGPGEEDREGFSWSWGCGGPFPLPPSYNRGRHAYRGPLTTVEVDSHWYGVNGTRAVRAVRVRPTFALLSDAWLAGAVALGLTGAELSRRLRRRGGRRSLPPP